MKNFIKKCYNNFKKRSAGRSLSMKTALKLLILPLLFPLVTSAFSLNPATWFGSATLGDTISTLDQFTGTSSPVTAITQRTYGKAIYITGLSDGCLYLASKVLTSTGSACGSGSGGGGGGNSKFATTSNNIDITPNGGVNTGIIVFGSSTIDRLSVRNGTTTNATTTNLGVLSVLSKLLVTDGNGTVGAYGGTSCTNQFIRSLSGVGAATCATVANTDLANSSLTVNGQVISLGGSGTITAASSTLLANNNNFSGTNLFLTQTAGDSTTKAATTAFVATAVSNAIAGVNPAVAVQAATTVAGDTSGLTYNNGVGGVGATFTGSNNTALTVDGYTFTALGQRLLVKNDTQSPSGAFNGIYYVTQIQTAILPPVLTRALDYNQPSDINNTGVIPVISGTVNTDTGWLLTSQVTTVGTDPLTYIQFSINPSTIVTTSRNILTTYPVQGGGTLASDLTVSLAFGTTTNNNWSGGNVFQNASTTIVGNLTIGGNATATNATTTNFFSTLASTTNFYLATSLCTGSSALQVNAAGKVVCGAITGGTSASSTLLGDNNNFTGANTFSNFTATLATTSQLLVTSSSTLQNFTGLNSTTTNATTTTIFSSIASSSKLFTASFSGANLATCSGTSALTWTAGLFGCTAIPQGTVTSVTATWPITSSGGTTPNITWSGLATSSGLTAGNVVYSTGVNTIADVATGTVSGASVITATAGRYVIGGALSITTQGGTFGAGNYIFPSQLEVDASTTLQNFTGLQSTTTNSTSTNLFSTIASTSNLYLATGLGCLQVNAAGKVTSTGSNCSSGGGTGGNSKFATTTSTGYPNAIFPNGGNSTMVGIGTSTPAGGMLDIASSTGNQLLLSDGSLTSTQWGFRSAGGTFTIATTSPSTFASGTIPVMTFVATTTSAYPTAFVGLGGASSTSTYYPLTFGYAPNFYANTLASFSSSSNSYLQMNFQNTSNGALASGDYVVTADNGTNSTNFADLGISSSAFSDANYTLWGADASYVFGEGTGLYLTTARSNTPIVFGTGGTLAANERMRIDGGGRVDIGTTTSAAAQLTISSSTKSQLLLTDGVLTNNPWAFRSVGSNLYLGTTSPSSYATATNPTLTLFSGGAENVGRVGIGSSTPYKMFVVDCVQAGGCVDFTRQIGANPAAAGYGTFNVNAAGSGTIGNGVGPTFSYSVNGNLLANISALTDNGAVNTGRLNLNVYNAGSVITTASFLNNVSGVMGIGTTTPFGQLNIVQGTGATFATVLHPQLVLTDYGAGANLKHIYASSTAGELVFGQMNDAGTTMTPWMQLSAVGATTTRATSTYAFATVASSTNFFGAGLPSTNCSGSSFLQWTAGLFNCAAASITGFARFSTTTAQNLSTTTIRAFEMPSGNNLRVTFFSPCLQGYATGTNTANTYFAFNATTDTNGSYFKQALTSAAGTSNQTNVNNVAIQPGNPSGGFITSSAGACQVNNMTFEISSSTPGAMHQVRFSAQRISTTTMAIDTGFQGTFLWATTTPIRTIDISTGGTVDQASFATGTIITVDSY